MLEAGADHVAQQLGQRRVARQQPAAVGDAVGDVLEGLGLVEVVVVEDAVLDDLAVQLGHAVDGVAHIAADVGHAHLAVAQDGHVVDFARIAGEGLFKVGPAAAVHLLHDGVDAGQGGAEDVDVPLLQRLAHHGVVGVGEGAPADVEGFVPAVAALVQQNAHQLGDGQGGMGVVQLDGRLLGQGVQAAELGQMVLADVADGSGGQKVLLAQAQDLALHVVVVGVEDLADELRRGVLADGVAVLAGVEALHVEVRRFGLPQAQLGNAGPVVALNVHVAGHGDDAVVVLVDDVVEAALPALLDLAVKLDLDALVGVALQPHLTAGQPVVGLFLLPAVHDLLLEDAVLVQDGVAGAGDAGGGHAVQVAGGQTAQAAVAEARVGLFVVDALQLDVGVRQNGLGHIRQPQAEQAVLQAAAHQKLHAQVVHLLRAGAVGPADELLVAVAHHAPGDERQHTIDLLVAGHVQRGAVFAGQHVLEKFVKFPFRILCQMYLPLSCELDKKGAAAGKGRRRP